MKSCGEQMASKEKTWKRQTQREDMVSYGFLMIFFSILPAELEAPQSLLRLPGYYASMTAPS